MMNFSRRFRLLRPVEFKRVFKQPIRFRDRCFRVLVRTNDIQCNRLGMAVSRKVCAKAVARNRIKRIVRESFREQMAGKNLKQTLDVVVLPTAQAANECNNGLRKSLASHWLKATRKVEDPSAGQHKAGN